MKKLYTLVLCSLSLAGISQQTTTITYNNIKFDLNTEGPNFVSNSTFTPKFVVPASGTASSIFAGNLWMSATKPNGQLSAAAETYGIAKDFKAGPVAPPYDAAYKQKYDRFWKISKIEINNHISNFDKSGYVMPEVIQNWPAITNIAEQSLTAPFKDTDGDGFYDPANGDYPLIKGDFATFYYRNDIAALHGSSGGDPGPFQVNVMMYGFTATSGYLSNSLFMNYVVQNTGVQVYTDYSFGIWTDFDLGNPLDDYVGTSSARNTVYCYNGDNNDEVTGSPSPGYGTPPPVQSLTFLDQDLAFSTYYTNGGGINGDPYSALDYYNYLHGKNLGGQTFSNPYFCDGDPFNNTGVTESNLGNAPGDRRITAVASFPELIPGQSISIDAVYIWSRATGSGPDASFPDAMDDVDSAQTLYDTDQGYTSIAEQREINLGIYPNPASTQLTISFSNNRVLKEAIIRNALGQELLRSNNRQIPISALPAGMYFIDILTSDGNREIKSFIKQ